MTLENFHLMFGETIMFCQIIEHDVKMIYAAMCKGDMSNTLAMINDKKWTLGHSLKELKKLDFSDENPYLSAENYNFLSQMAQKRDYWCHETYLKFIYISSFENSKEYENECRKLQRDHQKLNSVYQTLEKIRIRAMKDFNRQ